MTIRYHYKVLPFDEEAGLPQKLLFEWKSVIFEASYRFNSVDNNLILSLRRKDNNDTVFIGKVPPYSPIEITDPDTAQLWMVLFPITIRPNNVEIYIVDVDYYEEEI